MFHVKMNTIRMKHKQGCVMSIPSTEAQFIFLRYSVSEAQALIGKALPIWCSDNSDVGWISHHDKTTQVITSKWLDDEFAVIIRATITGEGSLRVWQLKEKLEKD